MGSASSRRSWRPEGPALGDPAGHLCSQRPAGPSGGAGGAAGGAATWRADLLAAFFFKISFRRVFFPAPPAIVFVKGSHSLGWIYGLYLNSVFSKGIAADGHSPVPSRGAKPSEADRDGRNGKNVSPRREWNRTGQVRLSPQEGAVLWPGPFPKSMSLTILQKIQ